MKIGLACFVTFVYFVMSLTLSGEKSSAISKSDIKYGVSATTSLGAGRTTAISCGVSGQTDARGSGSEDADAQISRAMDATMQGSIVPACDVILSLIAVLHLLKNERIPQLPGRTRQVLFSLLFRVIIAPNAP